MKDQRNTGEMEPRRQWPSRANGYGDLKHRGDLAWLANKQTGMFRRRWSGTRVLGCGWGEYFAIDGLLARRGPGGWESISDWSSEAEVTKAVVELRDLLYQALDDGQPIHANGQRIIDTSDADILNWLRGSE